MGWWSGLNTGRSQHLQATNGQLHHAMEQEGCVSQALNCQWPSDVQALLWPQPHTRKRRCQPLDGDLLALLQDEEDEEEVMA